MSVHSLMRHPARPLYLVALSAAVFLAISISGCRVHTEKGVNGQDQQVQVDTPFGGVHVNTGQTTAADLGLPIYPGAQLVADKDNDKSADVHMGFGQWELRVKAVNYTSADTQDKVVAFYKKALGRYGNVIACQENAPVGTPTSTSQGLTCANSGKEGAHIKVNGSTDFGDSDGGYQLKAGSPHHQHIVAFKSSAPGQTRFVLVSLDLPGGTGGSSSGSD